MQIDMRGYTDEIYGDEKYTVEYTLLWLMPYSRAIWREDLY